MMWKVTVGNRNGATVDFKKVGNLSAVAGMIARHRVRDEHRVSVSPPLSPGQRVEVARLVARFSRG
jgi:hypothetical protein